MELANLLQSISVIFASLSVALGINAWRREFVGKRKIELAEDVLINFYEARDAIRRIRSPFGFLGEGKSRKQQTGETEREKRILDKAFVVIERRDKETEVFNKLQASRYRFMARFGSSAGRPFEDLNKVVNKMLLSAHVLGTFYWREEERPSVQVQAEARKKFMDEKLKHEAALMEGMENPDVIAQEVEGAIHAVEGICRPIIDEAFESILCTPRWLRKRRG